MRYFKIGDKVKLPITNIEAEVISEFEMFGKSIIQVRNEELNYNGEFYEEQLEKISE